MAEGFVLAGLASSLASQLPQGFAVIPKPVRASLLAMVVCQAVIKHGPIIIGFSVGRFLLLPSDLSGY
ncbi:hypothetical protein D3C84_1040470 [compost metagenome]